MRRSYGFLLVLVWGGCQYTPPGPAWDYPTTTVEGRISLGEKPITRGWVLLQPFAGTVGNHIIIPIHDDGTFRSDQVPIGQLQVRIFLPGGLSNQIVQTYPYLVARLKLIRDPGSPLKVRSKSGEITRFDFDIVRGG